MRFTSPHPAEFTDDVIEAMATTPTVCPQLHMPLQSGSDRVLRAMRRSYRSEKFLGIIDRVRAAMPEAAITTDIIVGFPGETEEDFQATLDLVEKARFSSAFTFQYSPRPGTPAATMENQIPKAVVQERYERLIALQERITLEENRALVGREVEVLVTADEGRKDAATARMTGRGRDGRLVRFTPNGEHATRIRPGDVITTTITAAAPHHLLADGGAVSHRARGRETATRRGRNPRPHRSAWDSACPQCAETPRPPTSPRRDAPHEHRGSPRSHRRDHGSHPQRGVGDAETGPHPRPDPRDRTRLSRVDDPHRSAGRVPGPATQCRGARVRRVVLHRGGT